MPIFEIEIDETRTIRTLYTIEAESQKEAESLALAGETEEETEIRTLAVSNRELVTD